MKTIVHVICLGAVFLSALLGCVSCATVKPLPPADFSTPGWRVQSGQAIWQPGKDRAEMTGDLVFAVNTNGNFFVQFIKTPIPIVTAEVMDGSWQIEFGANEYHWQGQGTPPARFGWLQLPAALADKPLTGNWQTVAAPAGSFKLRNTTTGESLEGAFFP